MKPRNKLLSLAIAAALVGCGGTAPEKKEVVDVGEQSTGKAVVAEVPKPVEAPAAVAAPSPSAAAPEPVKPAAVAPSVKPAPAARRTHKVPTDKNSFLIVSEEKTTDHPAYGRGTPVGFDVNNVPGADIVVTRGENYKFIVDTGVQHDFYLTTSPAGWGGGTYTDGVKGQFIYKGDVTFSPSKTTPDMLYYQCRNHKYMGGPVFVIDKGGDVSKLKASLAGKTKSTGSRRATTVVTESSVKQKLSYAQMVIGSGSAKRIEASGKSDAIDLLNSARQKIGAAKASLAGGKFSEAMDQVNGGLRLMASASRAVATESDMAGGVNQKAKFNELTGSLKTYEGSYKKNVERVNKSKQPLKAELNEADYKRLVDQGKSLAGKGDYVNANKSLEKAQQMITSVLTDMLHAQTVVYDKNFETPKEEYEYELARLESYEELIPLGIEQKQPSKRALELVDGFVQKATKIKNEGKGVAAKGDHKMAIMAMQAATSNLVRALRMIGVN
jgi:hypothetical protein